MYIPSRSDCPGSMLACGQWLLQLSPSHGPLQSSTTARCAAGDKVKESEKGRRLNDNATKEKAMTASNYISYSPTPLFTLKTLCRPSGVGSLASTLFKSSCSAAKVSLYNPYMNSTWNVTLTTAEFELMFSSIYKCFTKHLSLLRVQYLIFFIFLWWVCVRRQGNHTVHTHFQQVEALILTENWLQRPEAGQVKENKPLNHIFVFKGAGENSTAQGSQFPKDVLVHLLIEAVKKNFF